MKERIYTSELSGKVGETVVLAGWVDVRRDQGKMVFFDFRDMKGKIQCVVLPSHAEAIVVAKEMRPEWVLRLKGVVNKRPEKNINPNIPSGDVELEVTKIEVLNQAETPPFELADTMVVGEDTRLTYRYLDLRSDRMQKNIRMRDSVVSFLRNYMRTNDFIEIETPMMTKGTPEGSREYIVPSRIFNGNFYVLPQSPQQFKQLSMVAGFEKYFQVARCMRDEDTRGDRQPEFTQLDMEASFVDSEDIIAYNEAMLIELVKNVYPEKRITAIPFPRISYAESMEKYGNDKPDMRENKEDPNELAFCWVVDFPMFESDGDKGVQAVHHPFTSPKDEDAHLLETEPLKARANAYDVVLNGFELGGGSIRIHKRDLQNKIFQLLGLADETISARFGHILTAFDYGAPPHGGIAWGIDRLMMILQNEPNIREVIAFPKTGEGRDLMMGAPGEMPEKTLRELGLQIRK